MKSTRTKVKLNKVLHVSFFSIKPNIYVGVLDGSAMYKKWYFELVVIQFESATHLPPTLRVGVANTNGFVPYPGGGEQWGGNAVGDDLYSYAFDGVNLWTGKFRGSYFYLWCKF